VGESQGVKLEFKAGFQVRGFLEDSLRIPAVRCERKIKFTVTNRMIFN